MTKKLPYKFLFFTCILLQFTFGDSVAQARNVDNLYLKSSSKTIKIKPKKYVSLYSQYQVNDSTFKVVKKEGKIVFFKGSDIVLRKKYQDETLIVNDVKKQSSNIYFNGGVDESLDLKEIVAVGYSKGSIFHGLGIAFATAGGLGLGVATPIAGLGKTDANKKVFNSILIGSVSSLAAGWILSAIGPGEYYYSLNDETKHKEYCNCSAKQQKKRIKYGFQIMKLD
jgi:hypothetical protein